MVLKIQKNALNVVILVKNVHKTICQETSTFVQYVSLISASFGPIPVSVLEILALMAHFKMVIRLMKMDNLNV